MAYFSLLRMLRAFRVRPIQSCLRRLIRTESNSLGWEDIKTIRANQWPVLKGEATSEKTRLAKSHYLKKRLVNTVPKWNIKIPNDLLELDGKSLP